MPRIIKTPSVAKTKLVQEQLSRLQPLVYDIIQKLDVDKVLYLEDKARMTRDLSDFIIEGTLKFIDGQRRHGGKLIDVDHIAELEQEIKDAFWYLKYYKHKMLLESRKKIPVEIYEASNSEVNITKK